MRARAVSRQRWRVESGAPMLESKGEYHHINIKHCQIKGLHSSAVRDGWGCFSGVGVIDEESNVGLVPMARSRSECGAKMSRQPARGRIQLTHAERQPRRIRSDVYLSSLTDGPSFEVPTPASGSQANASTADNKQIKYDCLSNDRAHNSSVGSPPFDSSGHRMHRTHLEPVGLSISNRSCRIWGMQQHPTRRISPHLDADCCATAETATTTTI